MTDYTELKRLAEAQPVKEWSRDSGRQPDMPGRELMFSVEGPVGVSDYEDWGFTRSAASYIAAADPAAILALIAENERVKARLCVCRDCGGQGDVYSGHSSYQGYSQPPEPDMDVCGTCGGEGVLGPLEDFESLAAERDQLKAELAGLRTGYEAYESVNKGLKAEVEALRKNAERYQWLKECNGGPIGIVAWHQDEEKEMVLVEQCADTAIDAAMGKGEQA